LPFRVRNSVFGPSMLWVGVDRTCSYTQKKTDDQILTDYNVIVPKPIK